MEFFNLYRNKMSYTMTKFLLLREKILRERFNVLSITLRCFNVVDMCQKLSGLS